jgi:3-hydroxymyristoyl/3-hydroxydecanoyl-(acyl carrier protein) dehydratase
LVLAITPSLLDIDTTFLPKSQMRQISRVLELTDASIVGEADLGTAHWVYPQHFPGDPISPGSLIIEAAGQLVALWAWSQGQRGRPRLVRTSAEFHAPVGQETPTIVLRGGVRRKRNLNFGSIKIVAGEVHTGSVDLVLTVLA